MPDMTPDEFKLVDWRTLATATYDTYMDGLEVTGKKLTAAQMVEAKKLHEWNGADLTRARDIYSDDLFGVDLTSATHKWGRFFWFAYFWKEAKENLQRGDAAEIGYGGVGNSPVSNVLFIFNKLFVKPPPRGQPFASVVPRVSLDTMPDTEMQTMLFILMELGFTKIPISVSDGISTAAHSWKRFCIEKDKTLLEIAWRSEDRTIAEIAAKNGFEPQAHDEAWALHTNMSAAWHPFSKDTVKGFLWYRMNQKDNCKYTVTSLAKELRVALGFPKLDTDNYSTMPTRDPNLLTDGERLACVKNGVSLLGRVTLSGTETRWMIVTKTLVAQVILEAAIFDTQQAQEANQVGSGFREMGVAKVPIRNIVGLFSFYRVHHGITEPEGFTALVIPAQCQQPELGHLTRFGASESEGKQLLAVLQPIFATTRSTPPIASAWSATGYKDPSKRLTLADGHTPATVTKIEIGGVQVWP